MKAKLSTTWVFVLLNMLFRDIHEIAKPEFLAETLARAPISEELFLVAGIALEIPIAMVILSRLLNYRVNRWANILAAALVIVLILTNPIGDLDDIFFASVEVISLGLLIWFTWKWKENEEEGILT